MIDRRSPFRPDSGLGPFRRRGAVLLAVLLCLSLVSLMIGSLLRSIVLQREHQRALAREQQAQWITAAAAERAVRQLTADHDYAGETWIVSPQPSPDADTAEARIEVLEGDSTNDRRIRVRVQYPAGIPDTVRITRQWTYRLSPNRLE